MVVHVSDVSRRCGCFARRNETDRFLGNLARGFPILPASGGYLSSGQEAISMVGGSISRVHLISLLTVVMVWVMV